VRKTAKGWQGIEDQARETQERRERASQSFLPELRVSAKNPGPFTIRFLEQGPDVNNYPTHTYKEPDGKGNFWTRTFTCLREVNQECPWCAAGRRVKNRGVYNVIQRQRPVLRKDNEGKAIKINGQYVVDGYEDTVVIANVGGPTAEMLRKADGSYQGLMSRDFVVTYSGDNFQQWTLSPAIDAQGNAMATSMSQADLWLYQNKRHDLDAYMKPPSQQEAAQLLARYGANSGVQQPQQQAPAQTNQFLQGTDPAVVNAFATASAAQQTPVPQASPAAQPYQPQPVGQPAPPPPVQQPPAQPQPASYS